MNSVKSHWIPSPAIAIVFVIILSGETEQAHGGMISIVNAGFEDHQLSQDDFSGLPLHPGWTDAFANVGGVAHPPLGTGPSLIHSIDTAPEGNQFGYARNGSGLIQILAATFDPALSYTLSVDAATSSLSAALNLPGIDVGYRIQLGTQAGGVLAFAEFTESGGTPRDDTFRRVSVEWNPGDSFAPASIGEPLQILLLSKNAGTTGGPQFAAAFDDVQLESFNSSAVPEPSTWVLFSLASIGFGAFQIRKRPQKN